MKRVIEINLKNLIKNQNLSIGRDSIIVNCTAVKKKDAWFKKRPAAPAKNYKKFKSLT